MINKFVAGLYIRLSREDCDKVLVSESIVNQKSLLLQYVKENNLDVYDIYIDDGFSGTSFERPGFNKMIRDIEMGKINMVITKDMSRLGRDYIGTGSLIEKYFPEHNVRYIAVTDNIDTFLDDANNDIAPFKAIMNDMYAKDISKKIRSSLKAKQKEGKWVGGRCPFGYDQDPVDKNHLIINKEKSDIVRRIYSMCLDGMTFYKIAKQLTLENIKTPSQYYDFKYKSGSWNSKTIRDILTNRMYVGDLVQNKRNKVNYKVKKIVKNRVSDYIVVENTHEAIIDKDIFYEVQKRIPKNKGRPLKREIHLFDGLLYCGDCGHRIGITPRRKKDNRCYTICNYYRSYVGKKLCSTHSNNYDEVESIVVNSLIKICQDLIDVKVIRECVLKSVVKDKKIDNKNKLLILCDEIEKINNNLDSLYLDKLNKKITEEQFERVKVKLENDLNIKQRRYNELNNDINYNVSEESKSKTINDYINKFLFMEEPSRKLIINLIDKIEIFEDKTINVKLVF